ncbi:hypothetical protein MSG28_001867 [Choristoneura fumiferana]|uniref:Uncharacterized protein n=1 Tax=Choristoneura fumiferana TaxID=7141 RepID=A0ACC0JSX6_CHOFU|nr:hypothetical protein MSG28_001867 [Choristoneura fumiferana]
MSPLARSLLALAAAALLHGACAIPDPHCTTASGGWDGDFDIHVLDFHLDQSDSLTDLPSDRCPWYADQVGVVVRACDPYGAAPLLELQDGGRRVHVTCSWTDGQQCPDGIDVSVQQNCR